MYKSVFDVIKPSFFVVFWVAASLSFHGGAEAEAFGNDLAMSGM